MYNKSTDKNNINIGKEFIIPNIFITFASATLCNNILSIHGAEIKNIFIMRINHAHESIDIYEINKRLRILNKINISK